VRAATRAAGVRLLTINALYPFNDWNAERAQQATTLAEMAAAAGCEALVLVPRCDGADIGEMRHAKLREALVGLAPILENAGLIGLVEPLGFAQCSLRLKSEAVAAIDDLGLGARFKLVHDTFHHTLAGEDAMYPERTGLIHISGVEDPQIALADMLDAHRVLVGPKDRLGNVAQIAALLDAGADAPCSFEPFAAEVHDSPDIAADLRASMGYISGALAQAAA
ncbi:MAG: TIM barrel protein, partial [Paracoccaceae bacterium]|nr:TIM barrel protein [Paracoccaceae bacterium]